MVVGRKRRPLHQSPQRRVRQLLLRSDMERQLKLLRPFRELVLSRAEHHVLQNRGEPNPRLLRRMEHLQFQHLGILLLHRDAVRVQLRDGDDLERHARL